MFWQTQPVNQSNINTLLENDKPVLKELLEDEYAIEELKCENQKFIEFLCADERLEELISETLKDPGGDVDDVKRFKYSHTCCEVLTTDTERLVGAAVNCAHVRRHLLQFVSQNEPLNPLLCSYFARILCLFVRTHSAEMISWMRSTGDFLNCLLKHIDSAAIADVLFRLVACAPEESDHQEIKKFYVDEKFGENLIALLKSGSDTSAQSNASHVYCELIKHLRESQCQRDEPEEDLLLHSLVSKEVLTTLLDNMFADPKSDSVIFNGVQIFITLVQTGPAVMSTAVDTSEHEPWDPDPERITETLLCGRLESFHQLLESPPSVKSVCMPCGRVEEGFGATRLSILHLVIALFGSSSELIHREIKRLNTINFIMELFMKFPFCNFLHSAFVQCVHCLLTIPCRQHIVPHADQAPLPSPILPQLFNPTNGLLTFILKGLEQQSANGTGDSRPDASVYSGHIYELATTIQDALQHSPLADAIKTCIAESPEELKTNWAALESDRLAKYIEWNQPYPVTSDREPGAAVTDEYDLFPTDSAQQAFNNFQHFSQTEFPEKFTPGEDFFADESADMEYLGVRTTSDLMTMDLKSVNADIPDPDGEAAFEALCAERLASFDDEDKDSSDDEHHVSGGGDGDDDDDDWPTHTSTPGMDESGSGSVFGAAGSPEFQQPKPPISTATFPPAPQVHLPPTVNKSVTQESTAIKAQPTPTDDPFAESGDGAGGNWANFGEFVGGQTSSPKTPEQSTIPGANQCNDTTKEAGTAENMADSWANFDPLVTAQQADDSKPTSTDSSATVNDTESKMITNANSPPPVSMTIDSS